MAVDFTSRDCDRYPGSEKPALKVDFASLHEAAAKLGVTVEHNSGGSFFSPTHRLINIDTKTVNSVGFVSLGQLTDEYLHAWNERYGRGKFLAGEAKKEHARLGRDAQAHGTSKLGTNQNIVFHKLEALNFVDAGHFIPTFVWRATLEDVRVFAYSWQQNYL